MNVLAALESAAAFALLKAPDIRSYRLGALGLRSDGVIVYARNGSSPNPAPDAHAEIRLLRKMDTGGTVYVARVGMDLAWRMARPCPGCLVRLRAKKIRKVFFTIAKDEYGCLSL